MRKAVSLAILATGFATAAGAQSISEPAGKGATESQAPVAPLVYQSPFARYRPFNDAAALPWMQVNDEVARIGGWKAYAREAYEAAASAEAAEEAARSSQSAPAPRPAGKSKPR